MLVGRVVRRQRGEVRGHGEAHRALGQRPVVLHEDQHHVPGHDPGVVERLCLDRVDREVRRELVVVVVDPRVLVVPPPGVRRPQVVGRGRRVQQGVYRPGRRGTDRGDGLLPVRAQRRQVFRRLDDRAVGEARRARPEEEAFALGDVEVPGLQVEREHVGQERHHERHGRRGNGLPADAPDQDEDREDHGQRHPVPAQHGHVGDEEPGHGALPQPRGAPGQQQRGRRHQHQVVQRVRQDVGLDRDLARVEQDGERGQARAPGGQAPVAEHGVDDDRDADPHDVLDGGDRQQGVRQRLEHIEQQRVAGRPDHAQLALGGLVHVQERVRGEQRGPERQRREHPGNHRERRQDYQQAMAAPQRTRRDGARDPAQRPPGRVAVPAQSLWQPPLPVPRVGPSRRAVRLA